MLNLRMFNDLLREHFTVKDAVEAHSEGYGLRLQSITTECLAHIEPSDLMKRLRDALPKDAVIVQWYDERIFRQQTEIIPEYAYNSVFLVYGSKEWIGPAEGELIPRLLVWFQGERPEEMKETPANVHLPVFSADDSYEIRVNKNTHILSIPRDKETDDICVIELLAKERAK